MEITLKPNTVITMVGPSHSGKSVQSYVIDAYLKSIGKTCKIISSDEIRKELLHIDRSASIPTAEGFAISEVTFKKLRSDLVYYMSHPCNTDVIIVDTTGLDRTFRQEIAELVKEQSYANVAIVFNLSKNLLFSRVYGNPSEVSHKKFYIEKQIKRLKEKTLPTFNKHDYMSVFRIEDNKIDIKYKYEDTAKVLNLETGINAIYGDVHQQITELKKLFSLCEEKNVTSNLLIGDYLDKDDESSMIETLDFVYNKCVEGKLKLIKANHEEYVYNKLKDPKYEYTENDETKYFTSLKFLLDPKNEVFKKIFFELYEKYSYDYGIIKNDKMYAYITHSPCIEKYLGKHSPKSLKMMRNTRFFSEDENGNKLPAVHGMKEILDESSSNKPLHIFGHVELGKSFHTYKNKIGIDTGCVSGGHLTAIIIDLDTNKKEFLSVPSSKQNVDKKIYDLSYHIKTWSNNAELNQSQEKRLRGIIKANPAFISGTVAPAPSNVSLCTIESVESAIELYLSKGINKVYAQKKHMGSRCQVYLFKDRSLCYATSRNGFKIKHEGIEALIDKEYEKYAGKFDHHLITDNELMPWRFLGAGLIDSNFMPYHQAVNADYDAIKNSGLINFLDLPENTFENIEKFNKQVEIYGADVEPHLETFGIIYKDGQELLTANQSILLKEFDIGFEEFDLNIDSDRNKLKDYYQDTIKDGMTEGIVLKPVEWKLGDIPCIKIRNEEYLRIVYGFDYTSYLSKYVADKYIGSKLSLSIKEHNLNLSLLAAYASGDKDTQVEIYKSLILEFEKEAALDPRL